MEAQQVLGGRYRLEDELGKGGMAVVWRARDEVLGRPVAVKLLAGRHASDPRSRQRIRAEARAAAALSHPNIAQVHDFGESLDGLTCVPYVVMELVSGRTLEQRLAAGPLAREDAFRIGAEVAEALAAAHAQGLVHRDVKPANVLVTPTGVKVVDFGIAAAVSPGSGREPDDELLGTPGYLAPERITGDAVQPASDVYAMGVLLYRMLTGEHPWTAESATEMMRAHVYAAPKPLPPLPDVPEEVLDLCRRCLHKDPARRPSAREVARVLTRAAGVRTVDDRTIPTATPALPPGAPSRAAADNPAPPAVAPAARPAPYADTPRTRTRRPLLGLAAAAVAVTAGLLFWQMFWQAAPAATGLGDPGLAAPTGGIEPSIAVGGAPSTPTTAPDDTTPRDGRAGPRPDASRLHSEPVETEPTRPIRTPVSSTSATPLRTTAPPAQERTLSSAGGSVRATCTPTDDARLLSWTPRRPYKVASVDPGPAPAAVAAFRHGNVTVLMTVTCHAGVPDTVNTTQARLAGS